MEAIKDWGIGIVLVSVVGTLVLLMSPDGSIEKQVRTAVSIVLLVTLVKPFLYGFQIDNDFAVEYKDYSVDIKTYENEFASIFSDQLGDKIQQSLQKKGIKPQKIEVDIKLENNKISVEGVVVIITDEFKSYQDKICETVKSEFGIIAETEVVN